MLKLKKVIEFDVIYPNNIKPNNGYTIDDDCMLDCIGIGCEECYFSYGIFKQLNDIKEK